MSAPHPSRAGSLAGAPLSQCGQCRRRVRWVRLDSGRSMPVDPDVDADGTVAAWRDSTGRAVGYVLHKDENAEPGQSKYVTHFATCTVRLAQQARAAAAKAAPPAPNVKRLDDYRGRATGHNAGLGLPGRRGR